MNKYYNLFKQIIENYGIEEDDQDVQELIGYLAALTVPANNKPLFTENGLIILEYMQDGHEKNNKAKDIAVGIGMPSKTVSGSIRKLVTDGYVEKFGQNPVIYSLTEQGINFDIKKYKESLSV